MSSDASAVKRKPGRPKKVAATDPTSKAKPTTTRTGTSDQRAAASGGATAPAKNATKKQPSLKTSVNSEAPSIARKTTKTIGTKNETSVAGSGKATKGAKAGQDVPTAIGAGQTSSAADSSSGSKKEGLAKGDTRGITSKHPTKASPILQEADWSSAHQNNAATSKPTSDSAQSPAAKLASSIAKQQKQTLPDPKNNRPNSTAKAPAFRVVHQPGGPGGPGGSGSKGPRPDVQNSPKYKSYARKWITTMIALPILTVTSYALYQRVMQKQQPRGLPGVNTFPAGSVPSNPSATSEQTTAEKPTNET